MLLWVWLAVAVFALIVLVSAAVRLFGRVAVLRRAERRLRLRQAEALRLRDSLAKLQQTALVVQERVEALTPPTKR